MAYQVRVQMRARQKTRVMPHAVECAQRTDGKRRQGKEEKRLVKLSSRRSIAVSDLHSIFQNGILRNRMGAAAARSGAPCVPTATPGPWDIPPAIGDAWFIHYPIYTGCVAARLETRSAAQRADHKTDQKTAVATPPL